MALSTKIIEVKIKRTCSICKKVVGKGHHVLQLVTGWGASGTNSNICSGCLSELNGEMSMLEEGKDGKHS